MPRRAGQGAAAGCALVAVVISGCGGTVVDDEKLEDYIRDTPPRGSSVASVRCPSGIDVEVGRTFVCTVGLADGRELSVTWRIRDEDANLTFVGLQRRG